MNLLQDCNRVCRRGLALAAVAVLPFVIASSPAQAQQVTIHRSSAGGERLALAPSQYFERGQGPGRADFRIDEQASYQTVLGFGASFLEAGSLTLLTLPPAAQEDVLRSLFDKHSGAGFSAMKTVIGATDFQSAGPYYTYDDVAGDTRLTHFSIKRDLGKYGVVPYIKRAQRYGRFILQAPMDFPPDWMLKDPATDLDVKPELYPVLTDYYLKYLRAYWREGIRIEYLSPFNEPGMYTNITVPEIASLVREHLGPALASSGLPTRLQLSESPYRSVALANAPKLLDEPGLRRYVASISYHGYDYLFRDPFAQNLLDSSNLRTLPPYQDPTYKGVEFKAVRDLHRAFPDLPLWQSEVCYFFPAQWVKVPVYDFSDGDFWGRQIVSELRSGASAWTYWNMILDETGGPWLVDSRHGNPTQNAQHPLVIINKTTGRVTYTGAYYYLAHFSKWVRPGAVRIAFTGDKAGVEGVAFRDAGKVTVELINSEQADNRVTLRWHAGLLALSLPAQSISTLTWRMDRE